MFRQNTRICIAMAFVTLAVVPAGADPFPSQWRNAHVRKSHAKLTRWLLTHQDKKVRHKIPRVKPRRRAAEPIVTRLDGQFGPLFTPTPFTPDLDRRGGPFGPPSVGGLGKFEDTGDQAQPIANLPVPGAGLLALLGLALVSRVARRNT